MDWLFSTELWVALLTLATLEIVLGIDNLVFISIAVSRLPPERPPGDHRERRQPVAPRAGPARRPLRPGRGRRPPDHAPAVAGLPGEHAVQPVHPVRQRVLRA